MTSNFQQYLTYHVVSENIKDIDPSYPMLRYVCERFELNLEQRYWLAWLYAATYCAPTVFYIYSEFQDYENVDVGRLSRWWTANRPAVVFQSDRRWIRSRNQFVQMFESYRAAVGPSQAAWFRHNKAVHNGPRSAYRAAYQHFNHCFQMGRFGLFLFLEAVAVVTGEELQPDRIEWAEAQSSRNGLCFAWGHDELLRGHEYGNAPLEKKWFPVMDGWLEATGNTLKQANVRADAWNMETSLCAFKKFKRGQRYPGYYIDRQYNEILKMQQNVPDGVCWQVLWDFRDESYPVNLLLERNLGKNQGYWAERFKQWKAAGLEPTFDMPEITLWQERMNAE